MQLDLHSPVTSGHVEGDPAVNGVSGIDVVEPRAALAVGPAKINVGRAVCAELPARTVEDILRTVVQGLAFAPDVGDPQGDDRERPLCRLPESELSVADVLTMADLGDDKL